MSISFGFGMPPLGKEASYYLKKGNELFNRGKYENAIHSYQNCMSYRHQGLFDKCNSKIEKAKLKLSKQEAKQIAKQKDSEPLISNIIYATLGLILIGYIIATFKMLRLMRLKPITNQITSMEIIKEDGFHRVIRDASKTFGNIVVMYISPIILGVGFGFAFLIINHFIEGVIEGLGNGWVIALFLAELLISLIVILGLLVLYFPNFVARENEGVIISPKHGVFSVPTSRDLESIFHYLNGRWLTDGIKNEILDLLLIESISLDREIVKSEYKKSDNTKVTKRTTYYKLTIIGGFGQRVVSYKSRAKRDEVRSAISEALKLYGKKISKGNNVEFV